MYPFFWSLQSHNALSTGEKLPFYPSGRITLMFFSLGLIPNKIKIYKAPELDGTPVELLVFVEIMLFQLFGLEGAPMSKDWIDGILVSIFKE